MDLVRYPNPLLNEISVAVLESDIAYIQSLVPEMTEIMFKYNGIGLAAVQVGILKRFCLVVDKVRKVHVLINPEVIEVDHNMELIKEGCLSLPYFHEFIERPFQITAKFRNPQWEEITAVFTGIEARCLLHELEHLDGILQHEKVSPTKRQMWEKKLSKRGLL